MDGEILAAVAAEEPAMTRLLAALVPARTLLGDEAPGQAIMRTAFADLGLEPFDVPLDPDALAAHPGGAPFSWDVAGKANVLATWAPAARGRPLADPLRPHRRRLPGAGVAVERRPVRAAPRGRVDVRPRRGRHEVAGWRPWSARWRAAAARARAARAGPAPVGRRGGVHGQRRARLCPRRPHRRRGDPHRAHHAARSGTPRSACCGSRCACSARPPMRATRRWARTRSRRRTR